MNYKIVIQILLVGVSLFLHSFSTEHESYLSVTTIKYNNATNTFECEMKLTAHDLENAIKSNYGKPFILDKSSLEISNNQLLSQYIANKFDVKFDSEKTYINFVGYEVELNDFVWVYFEIKCPEKYTDLLISNLLLTETFALQQNVTHITKGNNTQSFVFTKKDTHKTFNWNE